MPKIRPAADVSGRPLDLRDVDLDTFLHPKTIAVIGASEQSREAEHRDDAASSTAWVEAARRRRSTRCTRRTRRCSATGATRRSSTCPATSTSRSSSPASAVDTFEEVLAAQGQVRGDLRGRLLRDRRRGREARSAASTALVRVGRRAPARPEHQPQRVRGLPRRPRRPVDRARSRRSGHQGRPVFQGQEIGIRLTHWAPTGNEVDLEFADFARYFADQPEVGVIACYIEGFKDGRTLMLAADHAAQAAQADRDGEGRHAPRPGESMAQSHTGHLTGSDAVTSRGVPPVRRHARRRPRRAARSVGRVRRAPDPTRSRRGRSGSGARRMRLRDLRRHRRAHGRHARPTRACRSPTSRRRRRQALHDGLIPAYLRVSNPVDCGGPPVADARGRKILDAILADKNVDIVVVPITGAVAMFSEPFTRDIIEVVEDHDKPIFVIWGAPPGTDDTYYKRLLDGGLPVFRTFGNCVTAVARLRRLLDVRGAATARRSSTRRPRRSRRRRRRGRCSPTLAPGEALRSGGVEAAAEGVRHQDLERRALRTRPPRR